MLYLRMQGVNVHAELNQLIGELPEEYERVLADLPALLQPISLYLAFLQAAGRSASHVTSPLVSYDQSYCHVIL